MEPQINHGTYVAYARHACRCEECVDYQRARVRANRADRLASGRLNHGSRASYDAGCRCLPCRGARSRASRRESIQRAMRMAVTS